MQESPFNKDEYMKGLGIDATMGESGYTVIETNFYTTDAGNQWNLGGYIGEGAKTVASIQSIRKN